MNLLGIIPSEYMFNIIEIKSGIGLRTIAVVP